jgi:uridylate kinase
MGMLATIMNGLALQESLESIGCETRLLTACGSTTSPNSSSAGARSGISRKGRVVILAGGTGNPFVTTDTAAALRARELDAEIILKATRVDGVYSDDPEKNPHAVRYEKLSYNQVFRENLRVMDMSAIDMCRERSLPILVFNYKREGSRGTGDRGSRHRHHCIRLNPIPGYYHDKSTNPKRLQRPHGEGARRLPKRIKGPPHRPGLARVARCDSRGILRLADAD